MRSKIISLTILFMLIISNVYLINKSQNISYLENSKMSKEENTVNQEYLNNIKKIYNYDNKENVLIVESKEEIKDNKALFIVNAPNNQYFIQYATNEDKENAINNFKDNGINVQPNYEYTITNDSSSYNSWGVVSNGVSSLLSRLDASKLNDIIVAILDTGLDKDLFESYYSNKLYDYYSIYNDDDKYVDNVGHGTHIAGTIAESTPSNVKLYPMKLTDGKTLSTLDIVNAINILASNKKVAVMNMSFSSYDYDSALYNAIENAKDNGIICVAAAGNDNVSKDSYPAAYDNTISVSAVDSSKTKASFSNYGSSITFAAPGQAIKSINGYMSGTSMATPHISGMIGIIKSINPNLSLSDSINILKRFSEDLGDTGWDEIYGYGFVNFNSAYVCNENSSCDNYGVFQNEVSSYEFKPIFTTNNFGSINNILKSTITYNFNDGSKETKTLEELDNVVITDYDPYSSNKQEITIKYDTNDQFKFEKTYEITNPSFEKILWNYDTNDTNTIELTSFIDDNTNFTTLYFPEKIDNKVVTGIADNADYLFASSWNFFKNINNILLPESYIKIGENAFNSTSENNLKSITSLSSGISIGNRAFINCYNLLKVDAKILYVGAYAFKNTEKLSTIDLSNVTYIGEEAFSYSLNDASAILNSVTTLKENAFKNSYLKSLKIDSSLSIIPKNAFSECEKLETVELGNIQKIDDYAFSKTINLSSIVLPESLEHIGLYSFNRSLLNVNLVIPSNVTFIDESSFSNSYVTSVEFKNDIDIIPISLFANSTNLKKVILPNNLVKIDNFAFMNCSNLNEISFPNTLENIGVSSFDGDIGINKLILNKNISSIGENAFNKMNNTMFYVYESSYAYNFIKTLGFKYTLLNETTNEPYFKDLTVNSSDYKGVYDGNYHSISLNIASNNYSIYYSINNKNYNLNENPKIKDIGEYTIYYKIVSNEYNDYYGSNKIKVFGIKSFDSSLIVNGNNIKLKNESLNSLKNKISIYGENVSFNLNDGTNQLATNKVLKIIIYNNIYNYNLIVTGDVNGDGKVSAMDYIKIKKNIMGTETINNNLSSMASDVNNDGKISALDYIKIKKYIMNGEGF